MSNQAEQDIKEYTLKRIREYQRKRRQEDPERFRKYAAKYRATTNKLSVQKALYSGLCEWCRKRPQMKDKKLCPECYEKSLINIKKAQDASTANNAYHKWRTAF